MQQLLAALKQPQPGGPSGIPPQTATPPIPPPNMPPFPPYPQAVPHQQPPYPSALPPSSTFTGGVPPPSIPQIPPAQQVNPAGLPPNIMALLQTAQQRQPTPTQYGVPPSLGGLPPPAAQTAAAGQAGPQFQQLLSYLVCPSLTRRQTRTNVLTAIAG